MIRDLELERHGLKVVLRKTDNFLPGDGDYLLSGRSGLTRKEIARHVKADGEAYDRYIAELETVVRLLKKWLLRAPPNVGAKVSALPKLLSLGKDMAGLSLAETRIVHDFAVRSAAEMLDRHFEGELDQGVVRLRRRRRQFRVAARRREPPTSCFITCSARLRACRAHGATRSAAWARSPRRWPAPAARRASTSSSTRRSRR